VNETQLRRRFFRVLARTLDVRTAYRRARDLARFLARRPK
jgi:hypothetical protein